MPANRDAVIDDDPLLQGFVNQAANCPGDAKPAGDATGVGYAGDMVVKVVAGNADPSATVKETSALINEANGK